jgi:hypothetical protein
VTLSNRVGGRVYQVLLTAVTTVDTAFEGADHIIIGAILLLQLAEIVALFHDFFLVLGAFQTTTYRVLLALSSIHSPCSGDARSPTRSIL